jgi:hypothetical protein
LRIENLERRKETGGMEMKVEIRREGTAKRRILYYRLK